MKKIFICFLILLVGFAQVYPAYALETDIIETQSEETETNSSTDENSDRTQPNATKEEKELTAPTTVNEQTDTNQNDFVIEDGVLTAYNGNDSHVVIPEGVTKIGDEVFKNNESIQAVVFPTTLIEIGNYSFADSGLTGDVYFPNNLESIGSFSFAGLNLDIVSIPPSLAYSSDYAFISTSIDLVKFENGCTIVPSNLFGYSSVKNVKFAPTITEINNFSFYGCKKMQTLDLPAGLKSIDALAFSNCQNLQELRLPEGLTDLDGESFSDCYSLNTLYVPTTLINVGRLNGPSVFREGAFSNCNNLKTVVFGEGIKSIPEMRCYYFF